MIPLAHCGIITPNSVLPGDFSEILQLAQEKYGFQLIHSLNELTHYYSILHACVDGDQVLVFIPFSSIESLSYFEMRPFPTLLNDSLIVELNVENNLVLLTNELRYVAFPSMMSVDNDCIFVSLHKWLCLVANHCFFPSPKYSCLLDILIKHSTTSQCQLREVNVTQPVITHLNSFNY